MKTVKEVSRLAGVSIKTLHHYDAIGLLKPTSVTDSGYRLYDDHAIEQLHRITVYREIGFSLKEIQVLLQTPAQEQNLALAQQIRRMQNTIARLQNRIYVAASIQSGGIENMNWTNFDATKMDDHDALTEALYGKTEAYAEYKSRHHTQEQDADLGNRLMEHFARLGSMRALSPDSEAVQHWVAELQAFLTEHYYRCTPQILKGLGELYAEGGSMTENIDSAGGTGTGAFARDAIRIYCSK